MPVVSFRLPDDAEARLRRAGINPGALAKRLVEEEARRLGVQETLTDLARRARRPTQPVERTLRELRGSR